MEFLNKVLAFLCIPLVTIVGWTGLRSHVADNPKQYKNVILMIGDGMGENTLKAALDKDSTPLAMETMPVRGQSKTNSWLGLDTTDSAAGATALACGIRNVNGQVSVFAMDPLQWIATPKSLSEMALEKGKSAGVVTTDSTSGATPSAFSAHASERGKEEEISLGQLDSKLNLIWGAASASITKENTTAKKIAYVDNKTDWSALTSENRSIAQFTGSDLSETKNTDKTPTLQEMTVKAIDILDDNPNGFFLMVEAAHIDKNSHGKNFDGAIHHVREFDKAIKNALDYAETDSNTLVLVTADHETGGIQLQDGKYVYTTGGHTNANVPVFVNRTDAGFEKGGVWKNRQIGAQLGRVLGLSENEFPTPVLPRWEW